jgi:hypothetical protein
MTAKPRSKYRNVRVEVDGLKFDSKAEAARWQQLRLLEKAGKVRELRRQVRYSLDANYSLVGHYVADFDYWDHTTDKTSHITEDVKGMITDLSKWKMKHFAAQYGREVQIVRMGR